MNTTIYSNSTITWLSVTASLESSISNKCSWILQKFGRTKVGQINKQTNLVEESLANSSRTVHEYGKIILNWFFINKVRQSRNNLPNYWHLRLNALHHILCKCISQIIKYYCFPLIGWVSRQAQQVYSHSVPCMTTN